MNFGTPEFYDDVIDPDHWVKFCGVVAWNKRRIFVITTPLRSDGWSWLKPKSQRHTRRRRRR